MLIEGIVGIRKEAVLAAKRAVVTVEEVVEDFAGYAHRYYDRDNKSYLDWDRIAADRETLRAWMEENVMQAGPEVFAARVRGLRNA